MLQEITHGLQCDMTGVSSVQPYIFLCKYAKFDSTQPLYAYIPCKMDMYMKMVVVRWYIYAIRVENYYYIEESFLCEPKPTKIIFRL